MARELTEATDFEKMSEALDSMGDTGVQLMMDFMNEVCTRLSRIERDQERQIQAIKNLVPSIGGSHPDRITTDELYRTGKGLGAIKEDHRDDMYREILAKMATYEPDPKLILHTNT